MKKDLHDLIYTIWIDKKTAMIMRDEPKGTHHFEVMHNEAGERERFKGETTNKTGILGKTKDRQPQAQHKENQELLHWVKEISHKLRYAQTVHILGSGTVRHLLQNEIEQNKELLNITITNSACRKLTAEEFQERSREMMAQ